MTAGGYPVPVVRFVFNRPDFVEQGTEILRQIRPRQLIVVSDGPREGHPDDPRLVELSRVAALDVDWPCEVSTDFSATNLGCNGRLRSGLNAAFGEHERLVVLEDDTVPDPSFFPWALRQLNRYRDEPQVDIISGYNMLGRWGTGDHLLADRGSVYGWAGWSDDWFGVDHDLKAVQSPNLDDRLAALDVDDVVRANAHHVALVIGRGGMPSWDMAWTLARLVSGRRAVVPTRNLVRNLGFGSRATHTLNPHDFRSGLPVFKAAEDNGRTFAPAEADHLFDRWTLLVEYLSTYRNPEMAVRLHRRRSLLELAGGGPGERALLHLTPLDDVVESIELLAHLRAIGVHHPALERTLAALEEVLA